jgi:putative sterol carrier protein
MAIEPDPTTGFFERLRKRAYEPVLGHLAGTLRFDVVDATQITHWYVTVHDGNVAISRKQARADTVIRADKHVLDGICSGRENAMACMLRGVLQIDGDLVLAARFERLFPGPPPPG